MRRLFSTFAHGPPGMRLSSGMAMVVQGGHGAAGRATAGSSPISGALRSVWGYSCSRGYGLRWRERWWRPRRCGMSLRPDIRGVGSCWLPWGAALALIGPGAWSIDARLFGWRRLEI